jgi:DNA-binding MarR family transcriptional regulator
MPRTTDLGEGYRGVEGPIGYLLRQATAAFHTAMEHGLRTWGLNSPQYGALFVLSLEPGLSAADLARAMGVTPQAVNLLVAGMERRGFICREAHPTHGRILEIFPTPAGVRAFEAAQPFITELEEQLVGELGPRHLDLIKQWLVDAARVMRDATSSGIPEARRVSR